MINYVVASISLVCIFYTVTKVVGYSIDVFVAKFVATDEKLQKAVSSLISLTALRWGRIEDNKDYIVKTDSYVVIVKKTIKMIGRHLLIYKDSLRLTRFRRIATLRPLRN